MCDAEDRSIEKACECLRNSKPSDLENYKPLLAIKGKPVKQLDTKKILSSITETIDKMSNEELYVKLLHAGYDRMQKYIPRVFLDSDSNDYVAVIDKFPGLSGIGDTKEEALKEVHIALIGMLTVYIEDGIKLP